ncbi:MAG: ribosome maturation factor RimM [Clostridia bacterium]|nr:ribosome maturation factor RimM [Clostridia bacterium]
MTRCEYLTVGKVINTHGGRGVMKLECHCDSPKALTQIKTFYAREGEAHVPLIAVSASVKGEFVLLRAEGIDTVEAAEKYRNRLLYAKREDIPLDKGHFFIADLLGLPVIDRRTGETYGVLSGVEKIPVHELYEVTTPDGKKVLLPAVKEYISGIEPETGIYITPVPGFFHPGKDE